MFNWRKAASCTGIMAYLLLSCTETLSVPADRVSDHPFVKDDASGLLATLPDGAYQLCTEPEDPQAWADGAGTCLNVIKQGLNASGYFGYPHSSHFMCIRGELSDNLLTGEALFTAWSAHEWTEIPQDAFNWDEGGRLSLDQWYRIPEEETTQSNISWVAFQQATLNLVGLHTYSSPRMKPPDQLCNWSVLSEQSTTRG